MSTKAFFPCGGGSNLILGTGMENQIFILINSQKLSLWCKKKIIPHPYGFVWPIYGPLHYSLGVL